MGRREDEDSFLEALAAVEAALAAGEVHRAALPRVLSSDVARRLEVELRGRGLIAVRYTDVPRTWDVWDHVETVMGLDEDEPRIEWDSRGYASRRGRK